ncbi:hypothetical protein TNIN_12611 [Trichonephila inaurata madagascariensis]|uniref:Uncharacterized protein n=1 Tax=Trichonephila inaurata madagascariensis TaxID=2747483 RepID=A0A8X6YTK5_9ARAC|nr:hypothetical protein TNIN_12611 [Trichonephila inaurata madagascariensis]
MNPYLIRTKSVYLSRKKNANKTPKSTSTCPSRTRDLSTRTPAFRSRGSVDRALKRSTACRFDTHRRSPYQIRFRFPPLTNCNSALKSETEQKNFV